MMLVGCGQTAALVTPAPSVPVPTVVPRPPATPTRSPLATPTPPAARLQTFHTQLSFDTYETEETVQLQLGRLPGVASVNVTQLDVTVQYDAARLTEDEIVRTLRANPEVRIREDGRAGR
jgi:copper chaperone CopZ